jgi:hypothetical protein
VYQRDREKGGSRALASPALCSLAREHVEPRELNEVPGNIASSTYTRIMRLNSRVFCQPRAHSRMTEIL